MAPRLAGTGHPFRPSLRPDAREPRRAGLRRRSRPSGLSRWAGLAGLACAALLLLVPAASAQDELACHQATPCDWVVDLDDGGFADTAPLEATQGDWVRIDLFNAGDAPRTVRLEGYGLTWTVPAGDGAESAPFELSLGGDFRLVDEATGQARTVRVFLSDPADGVTEETGRASPLPALAVLAAVGFAAAVRRP